MRIIHDTLTGIDYPLNREDGEPVIGLASHLVVLEVIDEPIPEPGDGYSMRRAAPVDDFVAGTRTIGWIVEPLPPAEPEPPEPRWIQFGTALVADGAVNQFIGGLAQAMPVLHLMLGVGLGQAAKGDPATFLAGWTGARAAGAVAPALLAHLTAMAAAYDLPAEFIAGLQEDAEATPPG